MYISGFENKEDIVSQFQVTEEELKEAIILYAKNKQESYEGSAYVLFLKDGKLFEVHGSHCSCHGFENQWSPEETSYEELMFRWFEKNDKPYAVDTDEDMEALKRIVLGVVVENTVLN